MTALCFRRCRQNGDIDGRQRRRRHQRRPLVRNQRQREARAVIEKNKQIKSSLTVRDK